jgi:hypothetical protein
VAVEGRQGTLYVSNRSLQDGRVNSSATRSATSFFQQRAQPVKPGWICSAGSPCSPHTMRCPSKGCPTLTQAAGHLACCPPAAPTPCHWAPGR